MRQQQTQVACLSPAAGCTPARDRRHWANDLEQARHRIGDPCPLGVPGKHASTSASAVAFGGGGPSWRLTRAAGGPWHACGVREGLRSPPDLCQQHTKRTQRQPPSDQGMLHRCRMMASGGQAGTSQARHARGVSAVVLPRAAPGNAGPIIEGGGCIVRCWTL